MRQGFLRSSRYSPGNMDRESLEALFVGREDVMEDVVSRIADSIRQPQKHYILLIGPRGSGKTHFLSLAYHRILDRIRAAGLGDSTAIALLNEEEWGVASYLDLFVRILRSLAVEAPELFPKIEQISEKFSRDPADAEAFAASLIAEHTRGQDTPAAVRESGRLVPRPERRGTEALACRHSAERQLVDRRHHTRFVCGLAVTGSSVLRILHDPPP